MITELLSIDKFIGVSKNVDIAKGINKIPSSLSEGVEQIKRQNAWLKKR